MNKMFLAASLVAVLSACSQVDKVSGDSAGADSSAPAVADATDEQNRAKWQEEAILLMGYEEFGRRVGGQAAPTLVEIQAAMDGFRSDQSGLSKAVPGATQVAEQVAAPISPSIPESVANWQGGFVQGDEEYIARVEGLSLRIYCPTDAGFNPDSPSVVALHRGSVDQEISGSIEVNGASVDLPHEAMSNVGVENFTFMLRELRKGDALIRAEGKTIKLLKGNARAVLPDPDGSDFACNMF
ncbi:lipoprotein [Luteimonas sp. A537]